MLQTNSKSLEKKYNYILDMIVIEGLEAGGHLGYSSEELVGNSKPTLESITSGVKMAKRFVTTYECDASEEFKMSYINANEKNIKIIKSSVEMPGRAIYNNFIEKVESERCKIKKCYSCIKACKIADTPYCITKALINAVKGDMKVVLVFCGSNVGKAKEIISVHDLFGELAREL